MMRISTLKYISKSGKPTAFGDVENDANIDVEILGLNGKEDGAVKTEWIWVASWITVHLSDRIKAVFSLDRYLSVALVTTGRRPEEIVHTQRTLNSNTHTFITLVLHSKYVYTHTHTQTKRLN